ncbi:MAG TPA: DUF58 domain-containing protein [Streptosporangiaceae bacterium]|nr:DUF58 domain-containing protein [Streptosporangiaceae bacterium]
MLSPGRQRLPIDWQLSGHARRLLTLAIAGLVITVISRRAEFAGLAAPALLLLAGRQADRPDSVNVEIEAPTAPLTESEPAEARIKITGLGGRSGQVQVRLVADPWLTAADAESAGGGWFRLPFVPERWGVRSIGTVEVTLHDRWRLEEAKLTISLPKVTCYPRPAMLESQVVLSKLPSRLGEHPSRLAGEGVEFAGVRDFVPGDRQRRINWPATTRRGSLQLNIFNAERAQVTVLLMDVSTDVGEVGESTADLAVRAATGTAVRYLAARDRVGLISFGRRVDWIAPAVGRRQTERILNLITEKSASGHPLDIVSELPHAALPPGALVIVFSPLLSLRLIEALRGLRERGFATIVIDVLRVPKVGGLTRTKTLADLATRVWRMEQDAIRFSLRELGIPVVAWNGKSSLDEPLAPFTRRPVVNR